MILTTTPSGGVDIYFQTILMNRFTFHGVDQDRDILYTYAKDRDKALSALGPRIMDAVVLGLSCSIPTTGSDTGSLAYQHLLA